MSFTIPAVNVTRNMRGELGAKNDINMAATGRVLQISTYKGTRGIVTMAMTGIVARYPGAKFSSFKTNLFGDFSKRVIERPGRATEKAIKLQQEEALKMAEALLAEAEAYAAANPGKCATMDKGDTDARENVAYATMEE